MYPTFRSAFDRVLARRASPCFPFALLLISISTPSVASNVVLDFENFPDSSVLTTQYPGVTFGNAQILTAGISLNEFEFPQHSGTNVASDNGGPMSITFSTPAQSFGGYFTYVEQLTIDAFGIGNALLASVTSPFSNNEALSGASSSSPNELLRVSSSSGISRVTITGDPAGGSFALDDATYPVSATGVPEPGGMALGAFGISVFCLAFFGANRGRSGRY